MNWWFWPVFLFNVATEVLQIYANLCKFMPFLFAFCWFGFECLESFLLGRRSLILERFFSMAKENKWQRRFDYGQCGAPQHASFVCFLVTGYQRLFIQTANRHRFDADWVQFAMAKMTSLVMQDVAVTLIKWHQVTRRDLFQELVKNFNNRYINRGHQSIPSRLWGVRPSGWIGARLQRQ